MLRLYVGLIVAMLIVGCSAEVTPTNVVEPTNAVDAAVSEPSVSILVDGLQNPVGIDVLPNGGVLIAEEGSGEPDNSAGVTLVSAEKAGRLIFKSMSKPMAGRA